ncbi:hypothetical protein A3E15_02050 [Candidatus Woesebacteria bacterium RIFCSPHIGHO2_12_FULL_42_9]|uniref:Uncharacterized protein n=1 Tax=Candidatus Woesebacteria bacterium RIFCSPHIGHO2_12_FULL_42_9 TaxID=1802511 RepID=A0A1F8AX42_9BACT|nr:MAG: hypothetical protein A3E15_02050 [Candidatus Woesebacteria bacterium RIFCSPHIGHO2_12_FULL_42_9]
MASLTQTAILARKIIRYGLYVIVFLIVGKIVFDLALNIYRKVFPPPPPPASVAFGKLPKLELPQNQGLPELSYTIETPDGKIPTFKDLANQSKVYFMPRPSQTQLNLEETKKVVSGLGFNPDGAPASETLYRFPHRSAPGSLEINIITGVFSLSYDIAADPTILEKRPPVPEIAVSQVRNFLNGGKLLTEDLSGPTKHEFLRVEGGRFVSALSLSDANLIKINIFRKDYDSLSSLTLDPNEANVWFIVSGAQEKQMVAGEYHYFTVDETKFATYPIKTGQQALDELKAKGGYVVKLGQNENGNIIVRRIYLAYYDPPVPSDFFQPIIVFEGDNGFVAYVPAVTDDYYGE